MTPCPRCETRVMNWTGDAPKCAFPSDSDFISNNWNCATMNELRDLLEENRQYGEDESLSFYRFDVPRQPKNDDDWDSESGWLILCWYKNRGCTAQALVLDSDGQRTLTFDLADRILKAAGR